MLEGHRGERDEQMSRSLPSETGEILFRGAIWQGTEGEADVQLVQEISGTEDYFAPAISLFS